MFSRSLFRVLLFILLFGAFFFMSLPSTTHPARFMPVGTLNFPSHRRPPPKRPLTFAPPQPGSHRHRIKASQRPVSALDHHHHHHETGDVWAERADAVRGAFLQAYNGYVAHAAPHDELLPLSKAPTDNFNGWCLSYIESLDTLWLMGLYEEFDGALAVVANITFFMPPERHAAFFETVIRYLGGLLSAYALSQDPILLSRADDLGTALLPVFDSPSGLPLYAVNPVTGQTASGWTGGNTILSEALSCQLEYKYLAYLTGRTQYYTAVENIMDQMYTANFSWSRGLLPTMFSTESGAPIAHMVTVGAFADSAYEYLLKQWLLSGRTDTKARDMYLRTANAILDHLTYVSPMRNLLYVTDAIVNSHGDFIPSHTFEHLTCFLPGVLALGAAMIPDVPRTHLWAARGLAHTCWTLYADSPTGLAPDVVVMLSGGSAPANNSRQWTTLLAQWERDGMHGDPPGLRPAEPIQDQEQREYKPQRRDYLLRPETVESFYLLWRTTADEVWRERGWAVFEAMMKEARVEGSGFASVHDVYVVGGQKMDQMPSWLFAETFKYLFLLFTDDDLVPLDQWVFNTEAHPLPVFHWSEWEMERYGISNKTSEVGRGL